MTKYLWVVFAAVSLVIMAYLTMGIEMAPMLMIGLGSIALISVRIRNHHTA